MRGIRRCALLVPLLAVDPILAGRTSTQFDVTATVVPSCRSIGTPATWPRAVLPADPARLLTMDCGAEAGYRIRGPWPAAVTFGPAAGSGPVPGSGSGPGSSPGPGPGSSASPGTMSLSVDGRADAGPVTEPDGAITLTVEF